MRLDCKWTVFERLAQAAVRRRRHRTCIMEICNPKLLMLFPKHLLWQSTRVNNTYLPSKESRTHIFSSSSLLSANGNISKMIPEMVGMFFFSKELGHYQHLGHDGISCWEFKLYNIHNVFSDSRKKYILMLLNKTFCRCICYFYRDPNLKKRIYKTKKSFSVLV